MLYHSLAIILKKDDFRENDLLLTFYTKDFGKILAVSRGAKKIQSKLAGSLPVFAVLKLGFARGQNFFQLTSAEILKDFSNLKKSLEKIYLASYFLELTNQLIKLEVKDEKIFNLLMDSLEVIDKKFNFETKEQENSRQQFIIKLFTLLGYKPNPEVITSPDKLEIFLKEHLDKELRSERLIGLGLF